MDCTLFWGLMKWIPIFSNVFNDTHGCGNTQVQIWSTTTTTTTSSSSTTTTTTTITTTTTTYYLLLPPTTYYYLLLPTTYYLLLPTTTTTTSTTITSTMITQTIQVTSFVLKLKHPCTEKPWKLRKIQAKAEKAFEVLWQHSQRSQRLQRSQLSQLSQRSQLSQLSQRSQLSRLSQLSWLAQRVQTSRMHECIRMNCAVAAFAAFAAWRDSRTILSTPWIVAQVVAGSHPTDFCASRWGTRQICLECAHGASFRCVFHRHLLEEVASHSTFWAWFVAFAMSPENSGYDVLQAKGAMALVKSWRRGFPTKELLLPQAAWPSGKHSVNPSSSCMHASPWVSSDNPENVIMFGVFAWSSLGLTLADATLWLLDKSLNYDDFYEVERAKKKVKGIKYVIPVLLVAVVQNIHMIVTPRASSLVGVWTVRGIPLGTGSFARLRAALPSLLLYKRRGWVT